MLSFFRKYEKTFFLVVFAPAVLSLGITGVMVSSIENFNPSIPTYRVFEESISARDIRQDGRQNLDQSLNEIAWGKVADKNKVYVPDAELAQGVKDALKNLVAEQKRNAELAELRKQGLDQQKMMSKQFELYMKYMKYEVTAEDYQKFLEDRKMKSTRFENLVREDMRRQRLVKTAQDLAYVSSKQLWKTYQDEYHKRAFEVISVHAKDHIPAAKDVEEKELKTYWGQNRDRYIVPTEAKVHYFYLPFDTIRKTIKTPSNEELKSFYNDHPGFFRDDKGQVKDFDSVIAEVSSQVMTDRVMVKTMEELKRLHEQFKRGKRIKDMATIASGSVASYAATKKLTYKQLQKDHPAIAGEILEFWYERGYVYRASEPLLGDKAGYIFWLEDLKRKRYLDFKDSKDQVRKDYVAIVDGDVEKYFERNQAKYRSGERYHVDALWLKYDRLAKKLEKPNDAKLKSFFDSHKKDFEGKDFEKDKAEVEKQWRLDEAKKQAQEIFELIRERINSMKKRKKSVELLDFTLDQDLPYRRSLDFEEKDLSAEELGKDEILKSVSSRVKKAKKGVVPDQETLDGDAGLFIYQLKSKEAAKAPELKDVKEKVRQDIRIERGMKGARAYADTLLKELKGLTGKDLEAALKERKMTPKKSKYFGKKEKELDGYDNASQYISQTFQMEPGGGYAKKVEVKDDNRIDVLRCLDKQDAPEDGYSAKREELRQTAMNRVRTALTQRWTRKLQQRARNVDDKHMDYAVSLYTGDKNIQSVSLRQIALKPDQATLKAWFKSKAMETIKAAQAELAKKEDFGKICFKRSQESNSRSNDGIIGFKERSQLLETYGAGFSEKVFSLPVGQISKPIESKIGLHLVKVVVAKGSKRRIQHLVARTSADYHKPDEATLEKARKITRDAMNAYLERLKTQSLARIAKDVDKDDDKIEIAGHEKGDLMEVNYYSPFQRAIYSFTPEQVPSVFKVGGEWHFVLVQKDDSQPSKDTRRVKVFHAAFSAKNSDEGAKNKASRLRGEIVDFIQNYKVEGESTEAPWGEVIRKFQELARARSEAPTAAKGGALGIYTLDKRVLAYGAEWMEQVSKLAESVDKSPKSSAIFQSDYGLHIVEVTKAERPEVTDVDPNAAFEMSVIQSVDWK